MNKRLLAAATVFVAKTKKEMPIFLIISAALCLVKIVALVKRKCKETLRNRVLKKKLGFLHIFLT